MFDRSFMIFFCIISLCVPSLGLAFIHKVKSGENLSHHVLGKQIPGPVWGNQGSLKKVLKLNPKINNPNLIVPGQEIILEVPDINQVDDFTTISPPASETNHIESVSSDLTPSVTKIFWLSPSYFATKLSAVDAKTNKSLNLVSDHALGLEVGLRTELNQLTSWYFHSKYESYDFNQRNIDLKRNTFSTLAGSLGVQWVRKDNFIFDLYSSIQQRLFIHSIDQSISLDSLWVPSVGSALSSKFFLVGPVFIGWNVQAGLNLPPQRQSSDKIGYHYRLGIFLKAMSSKIPYRVIPEFFYSSSDQHVKNLDQGQKSLGLNVKCEFY